MVPLTVNTSELWAPGVTLITLWEELVFEKLNLSIDNVILWRFDALRYNSSNDYKFKVRVIDNSGNIYFDGDFENISSAESVYSVIRAVNEETKKGN